MPTRALDTHYNGYKFRSRLEARWAVFFDSAKVQYLYESEGFDTGEGLWYLPDFYLKQGIRFLGEEKARQEIWVEIKPSLDLEEQDRQKVARFVTRVGKTILLITGDPGADAEIRYIEPKEDGQLDTVAVSFLELADGMVGLISERQQAELKTTDDQRLIQAQKRTERLVQAYTAAREARFDQPMKICQDCGRSFTPRQDNYFLCYSCYSKRAMPSRQVAVPHRTRRPQATAASQHSPIRVARQQQVIAAAVFIVLAISLFCCSAFLLVRWQARWTQEAQERATLEARPTEGPRLPPTYTPVPTAVARMRGFAPTGKLMLPCKCSEESNDCSSFASQEEVQACSSLCRPSARSMRLPMCVGRQEARIAQ